MKPKSIIKKKQPEVLGLTGIIGTGKSLAAQYISQKYGYYLIDADKIGHFLLANDQLVQQKVKALFGTLERPALAKIVFNDSEKLAKLNAVMHPAIDRQIEKILDELAVNKKNVIIEAALLLQIGLQKRCQRIICLQSSQEVIEARLLARGLSAEEIAARLKSAPKIPVANKNIITVKNDFSDKNDFWALLDNFF